ncbi:response regulator transcription factor [Thalassobacillus sp. CUG 92003]|uniref:response regulator transcription factor n=1 Tax=Thalassobacillus sp. CUG 92003 TaxID=2736641 RepID=UPI0015E75498|nr:response regulator transcription factor [Thalassobacillus sp. CUG 92003]
MFRIYLVLDDPDLSHFLTLFLRANGFSITVAKDYSNIFREFQDAGPHLVLMDVELPQFDGLYWSRQIRPHSRCPLIFLAEQESGMSQVKAIENGGDDYETKPVNRDVLLTKINNVLRRVYKDTPTVNAPRSIETNGLTLNIKAKSLTYQNQVLPLTAKEFSLMKEFIHNPENTLSREYLRQVLWNKSSRVDDNTLTVNITRLRKKLTELSLPGAIRTIRGRGYKFIRPDRHR